jgi:hypothetical protein
MNIAAKSISEVLEKKRGLNAKNVDVLNITG